MDMNKSIKCMVESCQHHAWTASLWEHMNATHR